MIIDKKSTLSKRFNAFLQVVTALGISTIPCLSKAGDFPADAKISKPTPTQMLECISPMEGGSYVKNGGWYLEKRGVEVANKKLGVKIGRDALRLFGEITGSNGKGDFTLTQKGFSSNAHLIGGWFHLEPQKSRLQCVGFQIVDAEGEYMKYEQKEVKKGWQWVEASTTGDDFKQAYKQKSKNGKVDLPLKSIHVIWYAKKKGPSEIVVDGISALIDKGDAKGVSFEVLQASSIKPGSEVKGSLLFKNRNSKPVNYSIEITLARDPSLDNSIIPDPIKGSNHALGGKSKTIYNGKEVVTNTLTDGLDYTSFKSKYDKKGEHEAYQMIEVDKVRAITHFAWRAGDAGSIGDASIEGSIDGKTFLPIPSLQKVPMYKKWGWNSISLSKPFKAKYLKLTYTMGPKKTFLRLPAQIALYDGIADEKVALPVVGKTLGKLKLKGSVPASSFVIVPFDIKEKLDIGLFRLGISLKYNGKSELHRDHIIVGPRKFVRGKKPSQFGINAGRPDLIETNAELGVGWIRFENFKWQMISTARDKYDFNGAVKPWCVPFDQYMKDCRKHNIGVLPMMFLCPKWAYETVPDGYKGNKYALPPADLSKYGEFIFQSIARYSKAKVDKSKLHTPDKKTGMGLIQTFELGNEPSLNPRRGKKLPKWGGWAGTMTQFWEMYKHGAEGARAADPNATVVSPGWAGCFVDKIDQMRTYTYADGTHPLDYMDVISVHYYSGRSAPELASNDANAKIAGTVLYEEQLKRLIEWRDTYKPKAPIWMTETGYDTGGPIGTDEHTQARRLPRMVMLCLAAGIERVYVYREKGSTPTMHAASGMLRNDGTKRPVFYTYATLIRTLDGKRFVEDLSKSHDSTRILRWKGEDGELLSAWSVLGGDTFDVELGPVEIMDSFGAITNVKSTKGMVLSEFPIYIKKYKSLKSLSKYRSRIKKAESKRAKKVKALAKKEMKLINFGPLPMPISVWKGKMRSYDSVTSKTLYSDKTGIGFAGDGASGDTEQLWQVEMKDKKQVVFKSGDKFMVKLKPGTWEYKISGNIWGKEAALNMYDGEQPLGKITFTKSKHEASGTIKVKDGLFAIESASKIKIPWLELERIK